MKFQFDSIGFIRSPYSEKFAVPRQANLVKAGCGELHLLPPFNHQDTVRGLEQFSHLWLLFIFNQTMDKGWQPTVRPPRLGGNQKLGVFATRSTFRPNPIGLSAVELKDITINKNETILQLGSLDLVDGTPIIDIKPYIPYCDSHVEAKASYAQQAPMNSLNITFSPQANEELAIISVCYPHLKELISQVIAQDPRPAYKKKDQHMQEYGVTLYHFNIKWQVHKDIALVTAIENI